MMIIDSSEYMRNGDYQPTRFDAQMDAVSTVFQTKTDANPENTVGVMTMAGKGPEVLVTHSKELGQVLKGVHAIARSIGGLPDLSTALTIAQLALKHRENKNLRQRILVFLASPLDGAAADPAYMNQLARKLKKNNVAVDFVLFGDALGEEEGGAERVLRTFVETVSSSDNSHLVTIPPGAHLLSDVLISSSVLADDRGIPPEAMGTGADAGPSGAASNDFEFGVDPTLDPELAMALRMSMEEERARQAAEDQARSGGATAPSQPVAPPAPTAADPDEEELLKRAIAISQGQEGDVDMGGGGDEEEDEEAAIARAIEMSMQQGDQGEKGEDKDKSKKS